jgi:hypothetical protein
MPHARFGVYLDVMYSFNFFSAAAISSAAQRSCANIPSIVSDDPGFLVGDPSALVSAGSLELESSSLASSWKGK